MTYEFYVKCFDLFKHELKAIFNGILSSKLVPSLTWAEGVIVLLKKVTKLKSLTDLRLNTLLNSGYRLFMKILSLRLNRLIPKLTGVTQSSSTGVYSNPEAYADNFELFASEEDAVDDLMSALHDFGRQSGAAVNLDKSGILLMNEPGLQGLLQVKCVDKMNVLGLTIIDKWSKIAEINYGKIVSSMKFRMRGWYARRLNLIQRM